MPIALSSRDLRVLLHEIRIFPRRLLLMTPGVEATVPMLRGAWGAALHDVDFDVYRAVFEPLEPEASPPAYLFRPAPPDPHFAPAVDWFVFGDALKYEASLARAWRLAAARGLGPQRREFIVRAVFALGPAGQLRGVAEFARIQEGAASDARTLASPATGWTLAEAAWPLPSTDAPCRLVFPAPLRLRRQGRLIERPMLADVVVAACRRIGAFLHRAVQATWEAQTQRWLELARATPQGAWAGARLDLHRYSARQQSEMDLHGVTGSLALPNGPGELAPLLAAARWLHLGKGTVMGLGQMEVER